MSIKFSSPKGTRMTVKLPVKAAKWTQHEIKCWVRKQLCGAPPAKPKDVGTNTHLGWPEVKQYADQMLELSSGFGGLIINGKWHMPDFVAPFTRSKYQWGKDSTGHDQTVMSDLGDRKITQKKEDTNKRFWDAVSDFVGWYNQTDMKNEHNGGHMWKAGREMLKILELSNDSYFINEENLFYSIAQWGDGHPKNGYGATQLNRCIDVYKWIGDVDDHPAFKHRTTPLMKLMMWRTDASRQDNLFNAFDSGPLQGITDSQLNWVFAKEDSPPNADFKLSDDDWNEMLQLRERIANSTENSEDGVRLREILDKASE